MNYTRLKKHDYKIQENNDTLVDIFSRDGRDALDKLQPGEEGEDGGEQRVYGERKLTFIRIADQGFAVEMVGEATLKWLQGQDAVVQMTNGHRCA